jgi:hypothetical protein
MKTYNQLPSYVRAVNKRDQILERILLKARAKQSDELRRFISFTLQHVSRIYPLLNLNNLDPHTVTHMKRLEWEIENSARDIANDIAANWLQLKRRTYAFSWAATQKAMLNAGHNGEPRPLPAGKLAHHTSKKTELGHVADRIHLSFERLKRKVIDAVQMSRVLGESLDEALVRAGKAFPPVNKQRRLNVLTRAMVEANREKSEEDDPIYGPQFIDANDWDDIVSDYKDAYLPKYRDPRYELEAPATTAEGDVLLYPWQVEQEMTEDFVSSVRSGEVDSANEQGITDFVWIAILDSHTDDCCRKRDGLTNAEIVEKQKGEWSGDDCQAQVPPAHFNCRCRVAPATDNLPDKPASNAQDFEDWLNS